MWYHSAVAVSPRTRLTRSVAVYYFRSQHYNLGDALCWVDDNEKGAVRLVGHWLKTYNMAV